MKTTGLAIIAATLIAGSTGAMAQPREAVRLAVATSGVDFANPADVASFRRAAERSIAQACNPGDRVGADMMPDFKCRREMAASLEPAVHMLAMRATDRRMATVD